ncbi:MAG: hypothetical protein LAO03_11360 [Acidobacteriia bacterium]|nr:hypothetical protein [Terriglobia bacterium]
MKYLVLPLLLTLFVFAQAFGQTPVPVQLFAFSCQGSGQLKSCPNGGNPDRVIQASDGNFYGLSLASSVGTSNPQGGSLFKITPGGQFTLLHTFRPGVNKNFPGGTQPGEMVEGADGNLYGTTVFGGTHSAGVLFRIAKNGAGFRVLHTFCSAAGCADGSNPVGVTAATDGNIYGVTATGGSNSGCPLSNGCGTIFKVTVATGSFRVIHSLGGPTEGFQPTRFIQASDGNFYGSDEGFNTDGNVYKVTPAGRFSIVTHIEQLSIPLTPLTQGTNGNLFGLTTPAFRSIQALFEVGLDGSNFQTFPDITLSNSLNGSRLLLASDGNFWSTQGNGGQSNDGTIVQVSANDGSVLQTISFSGTNGAFPQSELIQAADGSLVGATFGGGTVSQGVPDGVVFTLDANLPPPIH